MSILPINTVQIENNPELVRDLHSKAVLSIDAAGLGRYKEQRTRTLQARQDSQETRQRLQAIEGEMATLKRIVGELSVLKSRG